MRPASRPSCWESSRPKRAACWLDLRPSNCRFQAAHCAGPSTCASATAWLGSSLAAPEASAPWRWGFLRDPGNLIGLELVTPGGGTPPCPRSSMEEASRPIQPMPTEPNGNASTAVRLPTAGRRDWKKTGGGVQPLGSAPFEAVPRLLLAQPCCFHSPLACWRRSLCPSKNAAIAAKEQAGCPSGPWPSPAAVGGAPNRSKIPAHLLADLAGTLICKDAGQGPSGGLRCGNILLEPTPTLACAGQMTRAWTYLQMLLPKPESTPFLSAAETAAGRGSALAP